jgi:hypothetical protein
MTLNPNALSFTQHVGFCVEDLQIESAWGKLSLFLALLSIFKRGLCFAD